MSSFFSFNNFSIDRSLAFLMKYFMALFICILLQFLDTEKIHFFSLVFEEAIFFLKSKLK